MLYYVALLTILLHLAFAGARVTLSLFAISLNASAATVGVIISLLALVPMFFAIRWGRYVDRVGVERPMYIGAGVLLAALVLAWLVPTLHMLFLVATLAGCGFSLFHIAANQAAGLLGTPQERAHNFTVLALAFSTSTVLGPIAAGYAIDELGHGTAFLVLSSALVAMLALMAARRLRIPRQTAALKPGERKRAMDLMRIPALRRVFVMSGMLSMAWDLFTFVMPIHGTRIGLSATKIGLVIGAFGAAVFVVRLVLPLVVHRLSEWKILLGAMFSTGVVLACIPFVTDVALLTVLAFLLGAGLGGAQPMIMALLYNSSPQGRGAEAVGVRTLLLNFSQTGIPLMFGALGAALGMTPVFLTMGFALIAGGWYARRGQ